MTSTIKEAYLDNAATTKPLPEVVEIMNKCMEEDFGNPSSKHQKGIDAEKYLKEAREIIANSLRCKPKEIIFTSGGTESNNQAIITSALLNSRAGKHVITTSVEHSSVLEPFAFLERSGFEVTYLPVNSSGQVSRESLENAIRPDTILVSVMHVNNEIGAVNDIKALSEVIAEANQDREKNQKIIFHVDAIQSFGKFKINPSTLGIDLMSVSGHKINGPKGSGFLYIKENTKTGAYIFGGGQESLLRSGTQNVPAIAGLGVSVKEIYDNHAEKISKLYELKRFLINELLKIEDVYINGLSEEIITELKSDAELEPQNRTLEFGAPHVVSASFSGIKSEVLLNALSDKKIYVSSGSACSSNRPELSGTLKAIGVTDEMLDATLRFSFSVFTTKEELEYAIEALKELLPMLRMFMKR